MSLLKIAHISDPHFATITKNFNQFLSKRWLGNSNLLLFRKKVYQTDHLKILPELFSSLNVDIVAITGDFTTTSLPEEFQKAKEFVQSFEKSSIKTFVLPGNHDIYTKESGKAKRFSEFFSCFSEEKVEVCEIKKNLFWIGLNCAYASNLFLSNGIFSQEIEEKLKKILTQLPKDALCIMGNHFPLYSTGNFRHDLKNAKNLQNTLKNSQIKLYLHGHIHKPAIVENTSHLPLVINSGSVSHLPGGTFSLIELFSTGCRVKRYRINSDLSQWKMDQDLHFSFSNSS